MKRDGSCKSLWQHSTEDFHPQFTNIPDKTFDALIVGGGITGVTTALLLQRSGLSCVLAEAKSLCFGTSGGTTAHINTFFDSPYNKVQNDFGDNNAELLAKGAATVMQQIKQLIKEYDIECEFETRDAFLWAVDEKQCDQLEELVKGTKDVGVPIEFVNDCPFPLQYLKVANISAQAQFNPAKYIFALAKEFEKLGGVIMQDCRVTSIKEDHPLVAETSKGNIIAHNALYATHIPPGVNLLHFRCAPWRSYAMALKLKGNKYPEALGYDMNDPYHFIRSQEVDGEKYLIVGGEDHKTGHETNTSACFRRLESYARTNFDVAEIPFKWSSQYFEPVDGLPYIGNLPGHESNMFVATGYGGNGMVFGTLAAIILSDMMSDKESIYQDLFNPSRGKPVAGFVNFVKDAADVVGNLITGRFRSENIKEIAELSAGEAKLVKYEGHTLALYKDDDHNLHALNPACTHIKCTVAWNEAEKTWDCPCHGSRFTIDGEMVTAPARKNLQQMRPEEHEE
jgi:glycine/D-amino acid oxidase-like deaminating enzyme/nitrite reductase/ring-hydroxylating ferredoxin subunit